MRVLSIQSSGTPDWAGRHVEPHADWGHGQSCCQMPASRVMQTSVPPEPPWDQSKFPPAARNNRAVQSALFNRSPLDELARARKRHGSVFSLRLFPYQALICATAAATNRAVLTDSARFAAGDAAKLLEPIVGAHSLILTPAPKHTRNRTLLMPPFHGSKIERWTDRIGALVDQHSAELMGGGPVAVRPWAQRLTLDVILQVVFGVTDPERSAAYRTSVDKVMAPALLAIAFTPPAVQRDRGRFSPGGVFARRRAVFDALIDGEIATRRADPDAGERDDVLSVLIGARDEEGVGFTDAELRDELKGLVVAGHETTATALAWTFHLLAHNPTARDELIADLATGSNELLRATIKESMRLRSPVIDAIRIATQNTELGGHPVPAGAYVSAMFCSMHQAADLWPEPLLFQPRRHLGAKTDAFALTPFGGGARRCLGAALAQLELEVVLRSVLASAVPKPAGAPEHVRLLGVTLVPASGGQVRMITRDRV